MESQGERKAHKLHMDFHHYEHLLCYFPSPDIFHLSKLTFIDLWAIHLSIVHPLYYFEFYFTSLFTDN